VEMIDVATPATYIRYTNNWNGDPMAWGTDVSLFIDNPKKEVSGLNNFLICGHWVGDLGLSCGA